jgi:membrane protein
MIWLYLGWLILLTGTQVAFYLQHPKLVRLGTTSQRLSPRLYEQEGLGLIVIIAKRFYLKQAAPSFQQLEQQTGLTANLLQELLSSLQNGGFIAELAGDESCYVLTTDSTEITVKHVLDCLRKAQENDLIASQTKVAGSVKQLLNKLHAQQEQVLQQLTLRELASDGSKNG